MALKVAAVAVPKTLEELERSFAEASKGTCSFSGYVDLSAALEGIAAHRPDLVVIDESYRKRDGIDPVEHIRLTCPDCAIVLAVSRGGLTADVEMMKAGAYDYLQLPLWDGRVRKLIDEISERSATASENRELIEAMAGRSQHIVSHSPEMERVLSLAARAAASDATILIKGESGTGKELVARAIHLLGPRRHKPFVIVNIAALSENLIESELFGHVKGSFTGAMNDRQGRFELADGGTLFIDEIGEVPEGIQVKLLRVLQFGTYERVGDNVTRNADVRIIAATNRRLDDAVISGKFRADLYYRINVVPVAIPPLRDHRADIPFLIEHFMKKHAEKNGKVVRGITAEAVARIMKYFFPGNVRELENFIERGVVLARGDLLSETEVFPPDIEGPFAEAERVGNAPADQAGNRFGPEGNRPEMPSARGVASRRGYGDAMHDFERILLAEALSKTSGNVSAAARALGVGERRLRYRMRLLGIDGRNGPGDGGAAAEEIPEDL
ncbi:MAG: sigma-54 dependent transcriptional regulator [Spirochaetes bacterium]|nr:sigma-54 dependent transcriptional regulator [Spirochaetota bacterium]